ncbi:MAG TPA: HAMP domain-containing sensor histidine kinase, partial [Candidatus Obscuribacter sp.]|nr:HAMP domain-containing sensor histidine kinase [Candidatus Obscuribacter sp.]
ANGIGSLLISLVMVWFFFGSIARRILKITEDTKYFKTNRKLPPIQANRGGQDEIYELEREFQDMARAVQEAGARREQFTSMISHDLRSPLAAINITLAMVQTGAYGNLNAVGQERINSAEKSIQRLLNLINQLLDTEKLEAGLFQLQISRVGLLSVVYPAVEALKQLADEKQIELSFRCQDYDVEVDLERMSQVVQNLLSNAIKFTPKWGKITLKSEETEDSYIVSVSDTGVGIKEEFLERIFDRFEQISEDDMPRQAIRQGQAKSRLSTADRLAGSGLGLSICKALVEAHGGEIGVHSLEGKGSTFWFSLPKLEPGKR